MHPVLLEFGFIKVFTYGLLVAGGFVMGIFLASRLAAREGLEPERIVDLSFYVLVASLLGARLLYVVIEHKYFLANPLEAFKIWKGGLVFYGGLMGAMAAGVVYIRKHDLPLWKVGDVIAPSLAIGQAIGRWGCFFAGCCYGVKTDVPWAITFTDEKSLAPLNIPLHPTQIYLSLNALLIFAILIWLLKRKSFDGQVLWTYGVLYSIGRFIIEYFRGDDRGYAVDDLFSTSQFIGLFFLALSVFMWIFLRQRSARGPQARRRHA
ncbi:MAG: prolipoprotein diacylglyceryl transferase [Nitrospinaceae bacterium]|nr:MAG: prolipoprotein diacylglyceryl transferase [Nitrospinaceae bacterium]